MRNKFLKSFFLVVTLLVGLIYSAPKYVSADTCDSSVNILSSDFSVIQGETFDVFWSASWVTYEPTFGTNIYIVTISSPDLNNGKPLKTWTANTNNGEQSPNSGFYTVTNGITKNTDFILTGKVVSNISCPDGASNSKTITVSLETPLPTCSITSFTAENTTPQNNTGTTLSFSLSGFFPWSIEVLAPDIGEVKPIPVFGTSSGKTVSTGNLTERHIYRLVCGSVTRDLSVTPDIEAGSLVGTIIVQTKDSNNNDLSVDWSIDATHDSNDFNGTGGDVFTKPAEEYRIIGSPLNGYIGPSYHPSDDWVTLNSEETITFTLVYTSSFNQINGICGTRNTNYPVGTTEYPFGSTYCAYGTPTFSPNFPAGGGTAGWYCVDSNGGGSSLECLTHVEIFLPTVTVWTLIKVGGSVKSDDGYINCGKVCSHKYKEGSNVTLYAIPSSSYWKFSGWSGSCSGFITSTCNLYNITIDQNTTALFIPRVFQYIEF